MADEEPVIGIQQQIRIDAFTQIVALVLGERGPECRTWDEMKGWASEAASWMQTGVWPAKPVAKLKKIDGGRDAPKAPGGQ